MAAPFILVIDDDPAFRTFARRTLEHAGYAVAEAGDAWSALRLLETAPQLICLDLMLPAISGLVLCAQLRSDPRLLAVPILAITARSTAQDAAAAREAGADAVLVKPVRSAVLLREVVALAGAPRAAAEALR